MRFVLETSKLAAQMARRHMNTKSLAWAMGCTLRAAQNYVNGARQPTGDMLTRMCHVLNCLPSDIMKEVAEF